ncbi:MAG: asparagine synthase-related protein [Pirellulaceae bacterium]|nr:asparagine synthase-related protein [Pirellulaceae bacterium]
MSQILGIFNADGRSIEDSMIDRMVRSITSRGEPIHSVKRSIGSAMMVARADWELDDGLSDDALVVEDCDRIVAADASLYYRAVLEERLDAAGVTPSGRSPSHLISAAYAAWGNRCAEHLEGEFAFIIFDRARHKIVCSRDFLGQRSLYFSEINGEVVVASSVDSIRQHPDCSNELDLASIGSSAAGWFAASGATTCYSNIHVLPIASVLSWTRGKNNIWKTRVEKHWRPPEPTDTPLSFGSAAEQMRGMLGDAVSERLSPSGPTTVWMSGGWDSTAVFGAGKLRLQNDNETRNLQPVSISYPPRDLGREDELIQSISNFWNTPVHWLDIDTIPLFDQIGERARIREQPGVSLYENWNRSLALGTRECGSRIALDGNGGDQLFRVTDIYLADLLRTGRWRSLARELRLRKNRGVHALFSTLFQPLIGSALSHPLLAPLGSKFVSHYLDRPLPTWIRRDFANHYDLLERERSHLPRMRTTSYEQAELQWMVTTSMPSYAHSILRRTFIDVGVEVRSPLLDRRIVELALERPRWERASGPETKRLLRKSMHGLLPDHVLAPRRSRTGITISYSRRSMKSAYPAMFSELLDAPLMLEEMGIVDSAELNDSVNKYMRNGGEYLRVALFHTLQAELWLRAQFRPSQQFKIESLVNRRAGPMEAREAIA